MRFVTCLLLGLAACGAPTSAAPTSTAPARCESEPTGWVTSDGAQLRIRTAGPTDGSRPIVVFVHDWGHDGWLFYQQVAALRGRFTVVTWDLRGHGSSMDPTHAGATIDVHAVDLAAITAPLGPVHLVGHGVGGWIALQHTVNHPDQVRSLTLMSTPRTLPPAVRQAYEALSQQPPEQWSDRLLPTWIASPTLETRPDIVPLYDTLLTAGDTTSKAATLRAVLDYEVTVEQRDALDLPVLVLYGELDSLPDLDASERFFGEIPNVKRLRLPRAGHDCFLEAADAVNLALVRHIGGSS